MDERSAKFPSSGELNFRVANTDAAIEAIFINFKKGAAIDKTDGISFAYSDWRFNIRASNTEPIMRLNVESYGDKSIVEQKTKLISEIIYDFS